MGHSAHFSQYTSSASINNHPPFSNYSVEALDTQPCRGQQLSEQADRTLVSSGRVPVDMYEMRRAPALGNDTAGDSGAS